MEELEDLLTQGNNEKSFPPSTLNRILILLHKELVNHDEKIKELMNTNSQNSSFLQNREEKELFEDKLLRWMEPLEKDVINLKKDFSDFSQQTQKTLEDTTNIIKDDTGQKISNLKTDLFIAQKSIRQLQTDFSQVSSNASQLSLVNETLRELIDYKVNNLKREYEDKLETLATTKNNEIEQLKQTNKELQKDLVEKHKQTQDMINKMNQTIIDIKKRANAIPETFMENAFDVVEVDGKVDIGPLVRGVYRDSRRIDGFNKIIAGIRLQSEDCVRGINSTQEQTRTLIHHCHDITKIEEKIVNVFDHKTDFLQKSIKNMETHIMTLFQFLYKLNDSINHTNANCSKSFDTLHSIFLQLTTRPFPLFGDFSDLVIENIQLKEMFDHSRGVFDVDREKFQKMPKFNIEIIDFETAEQEAVKMRLDELKTESEKAPTADENVLQESVEEIRMTMNKLKGQFDKMKEGFVMLNKEVSHKLETKADEESTQRIYEKMSDLLQTLSYNEKSEKLAQMLTSRQHKMSDAPQPSQQKPQPIPQYPPKLNLQTVIGNSAPQKQSSRSFQKFNTKSKPKQIIQRPTTPSSRLVSTNAKSMLD